MTQIRVHKQPRPRRRVQETPDAEQRQADRCAGLDRRTDDRDARAKIYDWLALPTWRD